MNLCDLKKPFPPNDIDWRVQQAGKKGDKVWALVLAYVTNRAIMNRLDEVCGPENWCNNFVTGPDGGILCGISIKVGDEWITKWDGAEKTQVEAVKGGLSGAMKRAAVQWGIGRYLYNLDATFAKISNNGKYYQPKNDKKQIPAFKWDPPQLPKWALPEGCEAKTPEIEPETHEPVPSIEDAAGPEKKNPEEMTLSEVQTEIKRIAKEIDKEGMTQALQDAGYSNWPQAKSALIEILKQYRKNQKKVA